MLANVVRKPVAPIFCMVVACLAGTSNAAMDWGAGLKSMAEELGKQAEEERKLQQQKELMEYQHKLELERIRKQQEIEEQRRQQQLQQKRALEEQARRRAEEERHNAISTGTGFFVSPDGYVITNSHVISDKTDYAVRDLKGRFFRAQLVVQDKRRDLALIKVTGRFPSLKVVHSDSVSKGQRVYAVGYPQISIQGNESKVTDGVISSFSGIRNDDDWFQISVPIQGGNSGGPLVTEAGQVVGVVVASVNVSKFHSIAGTLPQNINYAIKSKLLLAFLDESRIRNASTTPGKTKIEDVDRATVLVVAKNGPIDVSYSTSQEQQALERRDQARLATEEANRRKQEEIAERKRQAIEAAAERNRLRESAAEESRRNRSETNSGANQSDGTRQLAKRNAEIERAIPGWEGIRNSDLFTAWLKEKPYDIESKTRSVRAADVIEVLKLFDIEKSSFVDGRKAAKPLTTVPLSQVRPAARAIPTVAAIGRVSKVFPDLGYLLADVDPAFSTVGRKCILRLGERNIPCLIEKISNAKASMTLTDKTPITASMIGATLFPSD